jgi:hypothetical protein
LGVDYCEVPKRLKQFICNSAIAALVLGLVEVVYDQVGPFLAGDYFTLILWGIRLVTVAVMAFIIWRLYVGLKNGDLLIDD